MQNVSNRQFRKYYLDQFDFGFLEERFADSYPDYAHRFTECANELQNSSLYRLTSVGRSQS